MPGKLGSMTRVSHDWTIHELFDPVRDRGFCFAENCPHLLARHIEDEFGTQGLGEGIDSAHHIRRMRSIREENTHEATECLQSYQMLLQSFPLFAGDHLIHGSAGVDRIAAGSLLTAPGNSQSLRDPLFLVEMIAHRIFCASSLRLSHAILLRRAAEALPPRWPRIRQHS